MFARYFCGFDETTDVTFERLPNESLFALRALDFVASKLLGAARNPAICPRGGMKLVPTGRVKTVRNYLTKNDLI